MSTPIYDPAIETLARELAWATDQTFPGAPNPVAIRRLGDRARKLLGEEG